MNNIRAGLPEKNVPEEVVVVHVDLDLLLGDEQGDHVPFVVVVICGLAAAAVVVGCADLVAGENPKTKKHFQNFRFLIAT